MSSLSEFSKTKLDKKEENIKNVYDEYDKIKNMSQSQAQIRLMSEVLRQKQNGTFNYEALQSQVMALKGYLPEKDYQNLIKLLQTLKWTR